MTGITVDIQTGHPKLDRQIWDQFTDTIPANSSRVIDVIPLEDFDLLSYELAFFGPSQNDVKSMSMKVQQFSGVVQDQVFGRSGSLGISVNGQVNGLNFELLVQNSEAYSVGVCLTVLTT